MHLPKTFMGLRANNTALAMLHGRPKRPALSACLHQELEKGDSFDKVIAMLDANFVHDVKAQFPTDSSICCNAAPVKHCCC